MRHPSLASFVSLMSFMFFMSLPRPFCRTGSYYSATFTTAFSFSGPPISLVRMGSSKRSCLFRNLRYNDGE